ncbi:hypothetical protein KFE25_011780 [Diacronema lutheri]|uniref:Uncharacterized protein n=1 Tax=Diacronema lutheri TaxID=2081491 RepID=A0A8J5XA67_DIALT|nr:hypothetical protein KFE25_011780 [Diacronema lutheri]
MYSDEQHARAPASASPGPSGPTLPPVNHNSSLVAGFGPRPVLASAKEQATANEAASFNFGRMRSLLSTADDDTTMRKSLSTPAALSKMGMPTSLLSPKSRGSGAGGPMRRVSTACTPLTARRCNSFMWSMDVHRDFETAVQTLVSRGTDVSDVSAGDVLGLMKYAGASGLTEASVERHLQKRAALQQKLAMMLPPPPQQRRLGASDGARAGAPTRAQADAPAIAEGEEEEAAAVAAANVAVSDTLVAAMARQRSMQRQMVEQQRAMQLQALEAAGATMVTST